MSMLEQTSLPEDRDGFRFRGGHSALDLTATLADRNRARPTDLLASPDDLTRWLLASCLATEVTDVTDADLLAARRLREAIYMIATGQPSAAIRAALNHMAVQDAVAPSLSIEGQLIRSGTATQHLAALARAAIDLFGTTHADRIRECADTACPILFHDNSRKGDRRWCSMRDCGNRAKVGEFRRRKRAKAQPATVEQG